MRISDWSSDVCSSDLRGQAIGTCGQGFGELGHAPARKLVWVGHAAHHKPAIAIGHETKLIAGAIKFLSGKRGPLACGKPLGPGVKDRKSVVQGKSVSVSVDLGGRLIIKTKKHK